MGGFNVESGWAKCNDMWKLLDGKSSLLPLPACGLIGFADRNLHSRVGLGLGSVDLT